MLLGSVEHPVVSVALTWSDQDSAEGDEPDHQIMMKS
jgi:hypothetical protein